ncbi:Sec-independent protein translocase subunit TatA [Rhodococcus sp. 105337]|uniref:Sec-independent protein translocase subunit TatA n=1 Tax=Rhodococcus sp. 105337 TaxID=2725310 RepID=UPI00146B0BB5|nr:Sec-independent protein translocase subunit TatA [Rhodococcus sp. 105337]NME77821.1 Sec-independent protein translocase subunit TatA [Rhodococcus sp. 105337]
MGAMSPAHWAVVAVVLLVLFGSKKLPEAARGLGRSLRILKSEVGEMHADDSRPASTDTSSITG